MQVALELSESVKHSFSQSNSQISKILRFWRSEVNKKGEENVEIGAQAEQVAEKNISTESTMSKTTQGQFSVTSLRLNFYVRGAERRGINVG